MESYQAPHEKLTEEEIKQEFDKLLGNHLNFKNKWHSSDLKENEFEEFIKNQEFIIFKLRAHFFPETVKIMKISIKELSDMLSDFYEK